MSKIRQSDIIAITVSVIVTLVLVMVMMGTTKKSLRERAIREGIDEHNRRINNIGRATVIGGASSLISKKNETYLYSYLTTRNVFLLFSAAVMGYIISHFDNNNY